MAMRVQTGDIPWIAEAARRFTDWLLNEAPGDAWTPEVFRRPAIHRWTVSWICYERIFEDLWSQAWFQRGCQAFALIALERESRLVLIESGREAPLSVKLPDGSCLELSRYLDGQSLSIRRDPDFADLSWDPVSAASHLLSECDPS